MIDAPQRYEALSPEWVKAMREYVAEQVAGKKIDFELVWSAAYADPPTHLLRKPGDKTVGYTIRVKNGAVELLDGAHPEGADLVVTAPYDPAALALRLPVDEFNAFMAAEMPKLRADGKVVFVGDINRMVPFDAIVNIVEGFYSKRTA